MNWVFWALLIIGAVLLLWPFFGVVSAAVSSTLWIIGGLLLLAAIVWGVVALSRRSRMMTTPTT